MSDNDDNGSDFQEFKGSPDPPEDGINIKDIIMTGGFVIIIVGFVLGLIRLMALQGGETRGTRELDRTPVIAQRV